MKIWFVALTLVCWFQNSWAITVDWQRISGARFSPPFGWNFTYEIGVFDGVLSIDLDLKLQGDTPSQALKNIWENGIERIWSTDRFDVPIVVNIDWVESDWDQVITVHAGSGTANMVNWWTLQNSGHGFFRQAEFAAHEVGHMFGLWDEYSSGAIDPNPLTRKLNTGGLMSVITGPTLDYYYDDWLNWYADATRPGSFPDEELVPEGASTSVLLLLGLISLKLGNRAKRRSTGC